MVGSFLAQLVRDQFSEKKGATQILGGTVQAKEISHAEALRME